MKYLSGKIETALRYRRELIISSLIFLWIIVSGIWSLPPLSYVADLSERVKNSWVTSPELEPPFGHAELVSLRTFCKKQGIPLDQAIVELKKAGFRLSGPNNTLEEIAETKDSSGMGVYAVIRKLEPKPEAMKPATGWTPEKIEEVFAGTGVGRKTVGQVVKAHGIDLKAAVRRLEEKGITAKDNDKIKELADRHGSTPIKILTLILVDTE
jgi:hypothetical protein